MKVPLCGGGFALVDDSDAHLVQNIKWRRSGSGNRYVRKVEKYNGPERHEYMHIRIMGERPGFVIDHINGDPRDNRRSNLRWATMSQNLANGLWSNSTGFKGVYRNGKTGFAACINPNGRKIYLGTFKSKELAAEAYRKAALKEWGEFACFDVRPRRKTTV